MDTTKVIFLCGIPSLFLLSLLLLSVFWKKEVVRLAGLYSILPGLNMLSVFLISPLFNFKQTVIFSAVIEFIFIIPIVYMFRKTYKIGFVVPWLLLVFEIFRSIWLVLFGLSSRSKLSYFEAGLYYFYYFVPFVILIYCLFIENRLNEEQQAAS